MIVYCLFEIFGDGDSHSSFEFLGVFSNITSTQNVIKGRDIYKFEDMNPVHESMTPENNWTFVGSRSNCNKLCRFANFGGYLIEEHVVD
jgi:hypothetical protein